MLVDAVVNDFPDEMVQSGAVVNVTNVHPRPFAYGLEAFQNGDVLGTVGFRRLGE
jgi:hypothetical protein